MDGKVGLDLHTTYSWDTFLKDVHLFSLLGILHTSKKFDLPLIWPLMHLL